MNAAIATQPQPFGTSSFLPLARDDSGGLVAGKLTTLSTPLSAGADLTFLSAANFVQQFHALVEAGDTKSKAIDRAIAANPKGYTNWRVINQTKLC